MSTTSVERSADTRPIFLYFAPLTFLVYLTGPTMYLMDFTTSYMLKDQLHASATQVSTFRLLTAIPVYLAMVFGLTRDLWNPLGLRDRGYFRIFSLASAAVFAWMAFTRLSYAGLFAGMLLLMIAGRFLSAAYQGLIALVGQEKLMSGRLAALWQIVASIPDLIGALAGGLIAEHLRPSQTFTLIGVLMLVFAAFSFWKPQAVFGHAYDRPEAKGADLWGDIKRLVRHRAIYPAVLLFFLFQFSPGSNTPLQFYLTNSLHASDAVYGEWTAIFVAAFIPMFFVYGWLCKRVTLEKLLWWGTIIAVPQMIPLAFTHSAGTALILAFPIGALGGIFSGASYDLLIRSCPPGLQGSLMMLANGFFYLSWRTGDLFGSAIYNASPNPSLGFIYCVVATTVVYALMLPVLLLIPRALIRTRDGEASPEVEAERLAEIAETGPAVA